MHPALKVPEILFLIFKCDLSDHDLVNCALVCRLWGIWAPDVLWRTCWVPLQAALGPITKTSLKRGRRNISRRPYVEIGNVKASAWHQFLVLSNKITRITVDCGLSEVSLEQIELAKQKFHGEPFAQLRTLEMGINDGHHRTTSLLAAPCLTSVFLMCSYMGDDSLAWIANTLPVVAPNIVMVGVNGNLECSLDFSRYSALKHLKLQIDWLEPYLWESLSGCQLLTEVELSLCLDVADWDDLDVVVRGWRVDHVHLPALRELKFQNVERVAIRKLIFRSRMPMLECLWWDIGSKLDDRTLNEMVAQLKLYSPKLDIDMLYRMNTRKSGAFSSDSGEDIFQILGF